MTSGFHTRHVTLTMSSCRKQWLISEYVTNNAVVTNKSRSRTKPCDRWRCKQSLSRARERRDISQFYLTGYITVHYQFCHSTFTFVYTSAVYVYKFCSHAYSKLGTRSLVRVRQHDALTLSWYTMAANCELRARFTKYLTTILRLSYDNAKVTIDLR